MHEVISFNPPYIHKIFVDKNGREPDLPFDEELTEKTVCDVEGFALPGHAMILGRYPTEVRVLEVLDAIQQFIKNGTRGAIERESGNWNTTVQYGTVFEMPAE